MGTCALWLCALWGDRVRAKHRSNAEPSTIPPWGAGRAAPSQRMRATDPHPLLTGLVPMQTGQVLFASYCCCEHGPRAAPRSRKQPIAAARSLVPSCHPDNQAHPPAFALEPTRSRDFEPCENRGDRARALGRPIPPATPESAMPLIPPAEHQFPIPKPNHPIALQQAVIGVSRRNLRTIAPNPQGPWWHQLAVFHHFHSAREARRCGNVVNRVALIRNPLIVQPTTPSESRQAKPTGSPNSGRPTWNRFHPNPTPPFNRPPSAPTFPLANPPLQ